MSQIHPTAIIEEGAQLGKNVVIGPFSMVGKDVILEDDVILMSHVVVTGRTSIGKQTKIFPFASIGHQPQDLKYHGEPSRLTIGERNIIREYVTMQPGTEGGGMITSIGDDCLFMVGSHVAHDCRIGNHVILANNATLAGHVIIDDYAIIGGLSAIHQFVRIGAHAIIGGMSGVENDVIPYGLVKGDRAKLSGLNLIGLKRRGFSATTIQGLREAYRMVFETLEITGQTLSDRAAEAAKKFANSDEVMHLIDFIRAEPQRHFCLPKRV
jgi:UDP-N-acetylglucosamine acyltransferase